MLTRFARLPRRERGSSYLRSYRRYRCDMRAVGFCTKTTADGYDFDNTARHEDALVFQYTVAGEGAFHDIARGKEHRLGPGGAFLLPLPSETRYRVPDGGTWEFIYLYFAGDLAAYHVRRLVDTYGYLYDLPAGSRPVDLMIDLYERCSAPSPPDEFLVAGLLFQFLMELSRFRTAAPVRRLPEEIERARRFVEEHFDDPSLSVERIAAAAGYSKYHFSRLFKEHTGATPHAHLLQVRLTHALDLVTSSALPVKQVGRLAGFRDYPYFCTAFRRHTGLTPGAARRTVPEGGTGRDARELP